MQAVTCPECKLTCAPGDYGKAAQAPTNVHYPFMTKHGFCETGEKLIEPGICPGSLKEGQVIAIAEPKKQPLAYYLGEVHKFLEGLKNKALDNQDQQVVLLMFTLQEHATNLFRE